MSTERYLTMEEMLKRFEFLGAKLPQAVFVAMIASAKAMLSGVTRKLRGEYLNVQTGHGWQSMEDFARSDGQVMQAGIDTDVGYMKAHEEGFHGRVQVKAHVRRLATLSLNNRGVVSRRSSKDYKRAVLAGRKTFTHVRAHTMLMNLRARHFMRDTINEQFDATSNRVERAVVIAATTGNMPTVAQLLKAG